MLVGLRPTEYTMPKATDTTLRYLAMLRLIPAYPESRSTRRIRDRLRALNSEYEVSPRTVQRDLERLSSRFPLACEQRGNSNHWFWSDPDALVQIPTMSEPTAFALRLAKDHLESIIPPSVLRLLQPYFNQADTILDGTDLGRWQDKSAVIPRGPVLEPPAVRAEVQKTVYAALMKNRRIEATYRSREETRARPIELHPLGVVVRAGIIYLVATAWDFDDVRQYALHRMNAAKPMDEPARRPPAFDLAAYIRDAGAFSYPVSEKKLHLRALFEEGAALHLRETRLASDQRLTEQDDGRVLVEATVKDNSDLRWWLLGFGSGVEVLEPGVLREEVGEEALRMSKIYTR